MGDAKKMFLQVKVNPFFPLSHVWDTKKRLYQECVRGSCGKFYGRFH